MKTKEQSLGNGGESDFLAAEATCSAGRSNVIRHIAADTRLAQHRRHQAQGDCSVFRASSLSIRRHSLLSCNVGEAGGLLAVSAGRNVVGGGWTSEDKV